MDQISNIFNGFTNLMDQNIRGVQLGCYSVALVGLTVALRKVKPFSKFKKPSDIPNRFIKERRELSGIVKRMDPKGPLLMVDHKPLINIPILPSGQLPVKISGVNVTSLGVSWIQVVVVGSEIKFVPVLKGKESVECEVLLLQHSKDTQHFVNLGEKLVRMGFGLPETIEKPAYDNRKLQSYYNRLLSAEIYAIRKELGFMYYIQPAQKKLNELLTYLNYMMFYIIEETIRAIPKLPKIYVA